MTPQEQQMLTDLIIRVEGTRLPEKDPEAQGLIDSRLGRNPDALYVLSQTVLVQKYALEQAQAQLEQLRRQAAQQPAQQEPHKASFLGSLFGQKDEPARQPPPPPPPRAYAPPAGYAQAQPGYAQMPPQQQQGYAPPSGGGGSSFLRSAATTAAGVAAGALAFEGVESLMHGFGHTAGFGGGAGFLGGGGGMPVEETVVNNYYDSPGGERGDRFDDAGYGGGDAGSTLADARDSGADLSPQLDQADDVNVTGDDPGSYDATQDATLDDASYDDSGSDFGGGGDDLV